MKFTNNRYGMLATGMLLAWVLWIGWMSLLDSKTSPSHLYIDSRSPRGSVTVINELMYFGPVQDCQSAATIYNYNRPPESLLTATCEDDIRPLALGEFWVRMTPGDY